MGRWRDQRCRIGRRNDWCAGTRAARNLSLRAAIGRLGVDDGATQARRDTVNWLAIGSVAVIAALPLIWRRQPPGLGRCGRRGRSAASSPCWSRQSPGARTWWRFCRPAICCCTDSPSTAAFMRRGLPASPRSQSPVSSSRAVCSVKASATGAIAGRSRPARFCVSRSAWRHGPPAADDGCRPQSQLRPLSCVRRWRRWSSRRRTPAILVIDDASTRDSAAVLTALEAAHPAITVVRLSENIGLSRVRNLAAARAATEWVVFLDADDWLETAYVERAEAWLTRSPDVDVLVPDMTLIRGEQRPRVIRSHVPRDWRQLLERNTIVQTSFVRRELVTRLGGYDPGLDFEDWDFWVRALKAGGRFARLPGRCVPPRARLEQEQDLQRARGRRGGPRQASAPLSNSADTDEPRKHGSTEKAAHARAGDGSKTQVRPRPSAALGDAGRPKRTPGERRTEGVCLGLSASAEWRRRSRRRADLTSATSA